MGKKRIPVELQAMIKWNKKSYHYPLQFTDMVFGMKPLTLLNCIFGLFLAQILYKIFPKTPLNAKEALYQLYGKALTNFFFKEFTENYWGIPISKLSATFITSKMPRLTAVDIIKKALSHIGLKSRNIQTVDSALSEEILHYSEKGSFHLSNDLKNKVIKLGGKIINNVSVQNIAYKNNKITHLSYTQKNKDTLEKFNCDHLISTIPIPDFTKLINNYKKIDTNVLIASQNLNYKPISIYGLLIKKEKIYNCLYVYYRKNIFHRICEPKNAGLKVTPNDHTILIVEMTCDIGDDKWIGKKKVKEQIVKELELEKLLKKTDVIDIHHFNYKYGYPLYKLNFENHLNTFNDYINKFSNLQSIGRQGAFCFPAMHKSMEIGKNSALKIINSLNYSTPR